MSIKIYDIPIMEMSRTTLRLKEDIKQINIINHLNATEIIITTCQA